MSSLELFIKLLPIAMNVLFGIALPSFAVCCVYKNGKLSKEVVVLYVGIVTIILIIMALQIKLNFIN